MNPRGRPCGAASKWWPEEWNTLSPFESRKRALLRDGLARIGFASWPKWRLFGFRADPEGELDIDLGVIGEPSKLVLNYEASREGSIRVALLGEDGKPLPSCGWEASDPIVGDELGQEVRWNGADTIQALVGRRVTARLRLNCASIYAYEVVPARAQ